MIHLLLKGEPQKAERAYAWSTSQAHHQAPPPVPPQVPPQVTVPHSRPTMRLFCGWSKLLAIVSSPTQTIGEFILPFWMFQRAVFVILLYSHHIRQLYKIVVRPNIKFFGIAHKRKYILFYLLNISGRKAFLELVFE